MYIGIDVGGTKTAFALADDSGKILKQIILPSGVYDGTWNTMLNNGISELLKTTDTDQKDIKAIGVGAPSLTVELENQKIILPCLIQQRLQKQFRLPVFADNDANAAALGELHSGAGREIKNFLYLILGTGVGGALVTDGQVYHGKSGRETEFGHMVVVPDGVQCGCGQKGCLHLYSSGEAIARNALQKIAEKKDLNSQILKLIGPFKDGHDLAAKINAEIIYEAAALGDRTAQEVLAESLNYLAHGIVKLIRLHKLETIIIGGGMSDAGELLFKSLNDLVKRNLPAEQAGRIKIIPSALGQDGGVFGAVDLARLYYNKIIF
ncbi:ROK family protein [Candidatus Saganbacteria bacterium]|nr:ROK family protein [Candidatus Saganbacteria bacterium]